MAETSRAAVLVIGIGNPLRRDDGVGIEVARRLGARERPVGIDVRLVAGDAAGLIAAWGPYAAVVLVDAMHSGARPGTIRRLDASSEPLPAITRTSSSTHAITLSEVIELARALERLPGRVIAYAVEGGDFGAGTGLSAEVEVVVADLTDAVLGETCELAAGPPARGPRGARTPDGRS